MCLGLSFLMDSNMNIYFTFPTIDIKDVFTSWEEINNVNIHHHKIFEEFGIRDDNCYIGTATKRYVKFEASNWDVHSLRVDDNIADCGWFKINEKEIVKTAKKFVKQVYDDNYWIVSRISTTMQVISYLYKYQMNVLYFTKHDLRTLAFNNPNTISSSNKLLKTLKDKAAEYMSEKLSALIIRIQGLDSIFRALYGSGYQFQMPDYMRNSAKFVEHCLQYMYKDSEYYLDIFHGIASEPETETPL